MNIKRILLHLAVLVGFIIIGFAYFPDVMKGKVMRQQDMDTYKGMSKEIVDYRNQTGEEPLWTNRMFSGMPAYLISVRYPNQKIFSYINQATAFFAKRPISFLIRLLLLSYLAFLLFGVRQWLSVIGAIAYSFSSYFLIVIEAGHVTKVMALAYLPILVASIYYTYKKNKWVGSIIFTFMFATQLMINHLQITYYTFLIIGIMVIFIFIDYLKEKRIKDFVLRSALLLMGIIFAIGSNLPSIYLTYQYGKYSTRGKSELTLNKNVKTSGLDKDYITQWSYGVGETFTLLIPDFMGGASVGELSKNSNTYQFLLKAGYPPQQAKRVIKQMPTYWGTQPFTSGPVYVGAIMIFLFIMGLFLVKDKIKWWILIATILSILLAWGKNFMWFSDIFIDYFPGYNKFRAVAMILVIAEFTIPLFAIYTLQQIFYGSKTKEEILKALKYSLIILGSILLIFILFAGSLFSFAGSVDQNYIQQGATAFVDALRADRQAMLIGDVWRSLIIILLASAAIWMYVKKILQPLYAIIFLGVLTLFDLWGVDKRYVNSDDFVRKTEHRVPYPLTPAISQILQDTTPDYRVFNLAVSPFNDASTSYYVNSIGGYHGAKMKRYQELIEYHISKNNMAVLNMLNTKYFIVPTKSGQQQVQLNPNALGNAWFVKQYKLVANADSEILALNPPFDPSQTAIVDKRFENFVKNWKYHPDSTAYIKLVKYAPNHLVYDYKANSPQLVVFSEIYYPEGWDAYIDGKPAKYFRANYVLRSMIVPAGQHKIEFRFEPKGYFMGIKIAFAFEILLLIFTGVIIYLIVAKKIKSDGQQDEKSSAEIS